MRYREVKEGMKVRVKKVIDMNGDDKTVKKFIGKTGKVVWVYNNKWIDSDCLVYVRFRRSSLAFHHRELEQVK